MFCTIAATYDTPQIVMLPKYRFNYFDEFCYILSQNEKKPILTNTAIKPTYI